MPIRAQRSERGPVLSCCCPSLRAAWESRTGLCARHLPPKASVFVKYERTQLLLVFFFIACCVGVLPGAPMPDGAGGPWWGALHPDLGGQRCLCPSMPGWHQGPSYLELNILARGRSGQGATWFQRCLEPRGQEEEEALGLVEPMVPWSGWGPLDYPLAACLLSGWERPSQTWW